MIVGSVEGGLSVLYDNDAAREVLVFLLLGLLPLFALGDALSAGEVLALEVL